MKAIVRKYLLPLHRWTALSIGLVIVIIAATGAAMAFRPQLDDAANRDLLAVPTCDARLPLDDLLSKATSARPGSRVDQVRVSTVSPSAGRTPVVIVGFKDELRTAVHVNPCSGEVIATRARFGGMFGTFEWIHRFRFVKHGNVVSGTCVIMFAVVLLVGGIALWWPAGRSGWKQAFRYDARRPEPARTMNLHKTVGVYAAVIPLVSALTGLPLSFEWYKNAVYTVTRSPIPDAPPRSSPPTNAKRLPVEAFWRQARAQEPTLADALISLPVEPNDPVDILTLATDKPHANAYSQLYLDAYSGKVLSFIPYRASSTGNKLYFWMLSAHTGMIGGIVGQLLLFSGCLAVLMLAYTGIGTFIRKRASERSRRTLAVRVARKTKVAEGICQFELVDLSDRSLPRFAAGAHIDVHIREGLVRQYSLCNHPAERHRYQIAVLRVAGSRGGSEAMHDSVRENDVIEIGRPRNHFPLATNAPHSLLLAGGIGITPILSMAEKLASSSQPFELHYCVREAVRAAFVERITRSFAGKAFMHFGDGPQEQQLDMSKLLRRQPEGTHLYVCGPAGFMDAAIETARHLGWPEANLHREHFKGQGGATLHDTAFDVRIASSGKVFRIPAGKTVLQVLSEGGIEIPHSCEQGVCGTCATRVLEGIPEHRDLYLNAEQRQRNDLFMPCCSRARSDVLLLDL